MKGFDAVEDAPQELTESSEGFPCSPRRAPTTAAHPMMPAVIGQLVAVTADNRVPLVTYAGQQGTAAVRARSAIDLGGAIGRAVVLVFENGDPAHPIIMGVLQGSAGWPLANRPAEVEVQADGERLIVEARSELVLRCGRASITLTRAGKVLVEGTYVSHHSKGVMRIKGGSIELN